jgi:hypothetical protein
MLAEREVASCKQKSKSMRLTPEVLPMLQLRSCQLTLLTSLAFGAVLAVFSAPLTAQTTQSSSGIPNLSSYDSETRRTMELACITERSNGPVAYGACLNRQIASLTKLASDATNEATSFKKWRDKFGPVEKWRDCCTFRQWNEQIHHREHYEGSSGNGF